MHFDQWRRRIKMLGDVMFQGRCSCPREPAQPIDENDPDVKVLPPIDLPCPVCRGLRTVEYVLRIVRTSPIQSSDSQA
jgi:hypothetical protein